MEIIYGKWMLKCKQRRAIKKTFTKNVLLRIQVKPLEFSVDSCVH